MSPKKQLKRLLSFLQFLFGGRYSLLWLALTLLSRAILRSAEEITSPPEIVERAVTANTTEDERKAADAAWELARDLDLTSKGWYGRLRAEWIATRRARRNAEENLTSPWSNELRTLGDFCSRRIHLIKKSIPRSVVRPFVWALWSAMLALFLLLAGFSATVVRLFVFLLPEAHQAWISGVLSTCATASLPLAVLAGVSFLLSIVRGTVSLFHWLKVLSQG